MEDPIDPIDYLEGKLKSMLRDKLNDNSMCLNIPYMLLKAGIKKVGIEISTPTEEQLYNLFNPQWVAEYKELIDACETRIDGAEGGGELNLSWKSTVLSHKQMAVLEERSLRLLEAINDIKVTRAVCVLNAMINMMSSTALAGRDNEDERKEEGDDDGEDMVHLTSDESSEEEESGSSDDESGELDEESEEQDEESDDSEDEENRNAKKKKRKRDSASDEDEESDEEENKESDEDSEESEQDGDREEDGDDGDDGEGGGERVNNGGAVVISESKED